MHTPSCNWMSLRQSRSSWPPRFASAVCHCGSSCWRCTSLRTSTGSCCKFSQWDPSPGVRLSSRGEHVTFTDSHHAAVFSLIMRGVSPRSNTDASRRGQRKRERADEHLEREPLGGLVYWNTPAHRLYQKSRRPSSVILCICRRKKAPFSQTRKDAPSTMNHELDVDLKRRHCRRDTTATFNAL